MNTGKIYKIVSPNTDKIYIGSTKQKYLSNRLQRHRSDNNKCKSSEIINAGNASIILIEEYQYNNIEELTRREGELIKENINLCINKNIAGRTTKEYSRDNKEQIKINTKNHYENNKDLKMEQQRIRRVKQEQEIKCECGLKYTKSNKSRHCKSKKHLDNI